MHPIAVIIHGDRAKQPTSTGLDKQFTSPKKRRNKAKTQTYVQITGHSIKRQRLLEKLVQLEKESGDGTPTDNGFFDVSTMEEDRPGDVTPEVQGDDVQPTQQKDIIMGKSTPNTPTCPTRTQRRVLPDNSSLRLYVNWRSLIPALVQGFLAYTSATTGKALQAPGTTLSSCKFCDTKITPITALFFDRKTTEYTITVI
ncbi:hypothetical protein BJ138DRAFT_134402 [Hygrophoropsis aurantiaca]|uniref:Uncharacterized protein n=1 Tax=Hygrophoropsis aurantiaca TaxID=72124 RepID=A0ACB8AA01_9AGAM|nr:hypothetical protein BJ138DRAFT_134402 [Hygrophoropsis aurantiaca]